ncbi:hypothetical protein O7598_26545 [Micromonospora sp. WMMC241]|uniref:WXG100 family type VII secretion target n=1 Tax=Micromonospora sp. WMMC241 TaxID=3015159 RepID=UPI0022B6D50E|nr:hypothetical protein [Micromonospora sp. WMMC241]MCZ7439988.1 hypothetical protein [Micromonospora sp. WMMC241]
MSFSVKPGALERAASRISDASTDARAAKAYIAKHTDMPWYGQGLLNEAWPAHQRLVDEMNKRLGHLVELLEQSRDALHRTANHYRHTDARSAGRLDAAYPSVDRGEDTMAGEKPPTRYFP